MKYQMILFKGETQMHTIDSDAPFLAVNVGDEFAHGSDMENYGKVQRVFHMVAPLGDTGEVLHKLHLYFKR